MEEDDSRDGDRLGGGDIGALALHHLIDPFHEQANSAHGVAGATASGGGFIGGIGKGEIEADIDAVYS